MTALVRDDAVVVPVSLGSRSYDIVIGRGVIATLGTRIAELRPDAKVFIVSDENVAAHAMVAAQAALKRAGVASGQMTVPPGESAKSYRVLEQVCEAVLDAQIERGDRRSRRFRCSRGAARDRLRASADDAFGSGRFFGRRQDRH